MRTSAFLNFFEIGRIAHSAQVLSRKHVDMKNIWNEIYALGALDHPHILKLIEVFMDGTSVPRHVCLVD